MNQARYWKLIDNAWDGADTSQGLERVYQRISDSLRGVSDDDLVGFEMVLSRLRRAMETPWHICALFLTHDGAASSDSFLDYSAFVSVLPSAAYGAVVLCPDRLLDYRPEFDLGDLEYPFSTLAVSTFQKRSGCDVNTLRRVFPGDQPPLDINNVNYRGLRGFELVTRETCKELVPRLYNRYGSSVFLENWA